MHGSCTYELSKSLKIYECSECGALRSYFPGGDRGERPFEHSIAASLVTCARDGDLEDFARELPMFRNGAFWLKDGDWRRILRSVHRDESAWIAAFEAVLEGYDRERWTKLFRDARRNREAKRQSRLVKPDVARRLTLKDAMSHKLDELGDGFLFSKRESSRYIRWRESGFEEFVVDAKVHRAAPRMFGELGADGRWRMRRFLPEGTAHLSEPFEFPDGARAPVERVVANTLDDGLVAFHLGPRPKLPLDENALPALTEVHDAEGRRLTSWLAHDTRILRTDEGWVVPHEHVDGRSHPLTLRALDTFSVIARSTPGPWVVKGRVVRAEVAADGRVETPGPTHREIRRWRRVGTRLESEVSPRAEAPAPPLPIHVGGGLYRDDGRYGFVENHALLWTEPGRALRVEGSPRDALLFTEGNRKYRRVDLITGARGPWYPRDAGDEPPTACGAEGVIIMCPNAECVKLDADGVSSLAKLPFLATPVAYFAGSGAVLVSAVDDFAKRAVVMSDGSVMELPKRWKRLSLGAGRFGPVFASGRDEVALLGAWPS